MTEWGDDMELHDSVEDFVASRAPSEDVLSRWGLYGGKHHAKARIESYISALMARGMTREQALRTGVLEAQCILASSAPVARKVHGNAERRLEASRDEWERELRARAAQMAPDVPGFDKVVQVPGMAVYVRQGSSPVIRRPWWRRNLHAILFVAACVGLWFAVNWAW